VTTLTFIYYSETAYSLRLVLFLHWTAWK